ncbi:hypothetical protein [Algoriphagus terrigena]|uniref:hypothetical protein n=1 Tax=Algoriphagus terrigena TaxID=344884 RepID=UPI00047E866A|nr:hypothetical protein [Algoriphagus terrigena]
MISLLKYRAALIAVIFGLFGGAISHLLKIEELTFYYTALASIIALVVNLMVSFLLKGKWNTHTKYSLKAVCLFLFAGLILILYTHTRYFLEGTFPYKNFEGQVSYYIKGTDYTPIAKDFKKENPYIQSDEDLMREGFGSPDEKDKVWTQDSINKVWMKLITSYCLVVILFVALVSVLIEILMTKYGKSTKRLIEEI